eukprot:TRINITY_DN7202_c0_g2_i1.p1 TRINITY_DN7202_c0_g2~~TRINITY_DN7202_c0_g2_i1.p1  ORF type:complete len:228 (+),score=36.58 TRINITY_DN7202_c0_g2_i1:70-753(+)
MPTFQEWYQTLPPVTRTYLSLAVATSALATFGILSPFHLFLDFDLVFKKFQIWRLVTNFLFFGTFSLPFVFQMFILSRYCTALESGFFTGNRGTAEFVFIMLFSASVLLVIAYLVKGLVFLGPALEFAILYIWSRKDPDRPVAVWGFTFPGWQLPFVMMLVGLLMGSSPLLDILGILVGHTFHFLHDILPLSHGLQLIKTPQILYDYFDQAQVNRPAWNRAQGYRLG